MSDPARDFFESQSPNSIAVGVDFGTTNTVAGFCINGDSSVPDRVLYGGELASTRSLLDVGDLEKGRGTVLFGRSAELNAESVDPRNLIANFKSELGCTKKRRKEFQDRYAGRSSNDIQFDPEDAVSFVLKFVKNRAARQLRDSGRSETINRAVVGVPARASQEYRLGLLAAAEIAGLGSVLLVPEPVAACWMYYQNRPTNEPLRLLVIDIGAGTTDLSLVDLRPDGFRILLTLGDTECGGTSVDHQIIRFLAEKEKRVPPSLINFSNWQRVRRAKESANSITVRKLMLVQKNQLALTDAVGSHVMVELTGAEIHRCAERVAARLDPLFRNMFLEGVQQLAPADRERPVENLMLVGGGCRTRAFLDQLASIIESPALVKFFRLRRKFSAETADQFVHDSYFAVARGLALIGKGLSRDRAAATERYFTDRLIDPLGLGVTSDSLPIGVLANEVHFPAFTPIGDNKGAWRKYGVPQRTWGTTVSKVDLAVLAGGGHWVDPDNPAGAERFLSTSRCLGRVTFSLAHPRDGKAVSIGVLYEMDHSGVITVRVRDLGCEHPVEGFIPEQPEDQATVFKLDFGQLDAPIIQKKRDQLSKVTVRGDFIDEANYGEATAR